MADQLNAVDLDALEQRLVEIEPILRFNEARALIQRLREAEAQLARIKLPPHNANYGTLARHWMLRAEEAEAALIACAVPLEALNADNHMGAKWMAPSVKQHVAEAVTAIRKALRITENATAHKAGKP